MNFEILRENYRNSRSKGTSVSKIELDKIKAYCLEQDDKIFYYRYLAMKADYTYFTGDLETSFTYALEVISNLENVFVCKELAEMYNIIGVIYINKNEPSLGLNYFLKSIEFAKEIKYHLLEATINNNIGCLYDSAGDVESAKEYFEKSIENYKLEDNEETRIFVAYMNKAYAECNLNRFEEAEISMNQALDAYNKRNDVNYISNMKSLECYVNYGLGRYDVFKEKFNELLKSISTSNIDGYREAITVCRKMLDVDVDLTFKAINIIDEATRECHEVPFQIGVVELYIAYYKKINNQDLLAHQYELYYNLQKESASNYKKIMKEGIVSKIKLDQISKESEDLKKENLKDSLTNLYNRRALSTIFNPKFYQYKENYNLALFILDVDYFKQLNDGYGHLKGDETLKNIAGILGKLEDKNVTFLRYGGDEFLGLFVDYSLDEIRSIANMIKNEVMALNIENKNAASDLKVITVTQGVYYGKALKEENIYDIIAKADLALYNAKVKRNSFEIVS